MSFPTGLVVGGLILAYITGQWLMLRPSGRERELEVLREAARKQGWSVHLVKAPDWIAKHQGSLIARYDWAWPDCPAGQRALPVPQGEWVTQGQGNLSQVLAGMQPWLQRWKGVDTVHDQLRIYWDEQASPEEIALMTGNLRQQTLDHP